LSGARSEVKAGAPAAEARGFSRHLEGWQPALILLAIVCLATLLAVPHAAAPEAIPLPNIDYREAARTARVDKERALRASTVQLPYEVRAVGELLREFGDASAAENASVAAAKLFELEKAARVAKQKYGDPALLELCSAQTELFVEALARFERGEDDRKEINELGGNFLEKAETSRWLRSERKLLLGDPERRAMFRIRWVDLTGLRNEPAFAPSANDWRIYYRFLLEHPERGRGLGLPAQEQLRYVAAVEKVDPGYPGTFTRGVLYYRLALWQKSAESFRVFLSEHRSGPWRLRARNHLLAALEHAGRDAPPP
jgi:hypothetical protein